MNDDLRSPSNGRPMNVLVVDDDDGFRVVMQRRLTASRHQVECVPNGEAALERLAARAFDVVLLDLRMPGLGGLETLKRIREADWPSEVVVLTGQPDYDDCVTAMKSGAFHYLCKPTEPALIEDALQRAVDHLRLRKENAAWRRMLRPAGASEFVGESPAIRAVLEMTKQIAPTEGRVVILGESGTGKGVLARAIHALSRRRTKPFVDVHCGAVADQLLESELFGHERGAFSWPRIEIWTSWSVRAGSGRICSTASTCFASRCRRCASDSRMCHASSRISLSCTGGEDLGRRP